MVTTSRASFSVPDLDELPHILAQDLKIQLLPYLASLLQQKVDEGLRSHIHVDVLEEVIRLAGTGILR